MFAYGSNNHLYFMTAMLFLIAVVTRLTPFWFKEHFVKSELMMKAGALFPASIMMCLFLHGMEPVRFFEYPYGIPELLCLVISVSIYLKTRNLIMALMPGSVLYVIIVNWQ